jgi:eukaryotic-like serine/threonine-protein kinase
MNCPGCHKALAENTRFCTSCGTPLAPVEDSPSIASSDTPTRLVNNYPAYELEPDDPLIGRVLESKYKLIDRLGEGGMGVVYRATRIHIGDEVAVKVLHSNYVKDRATLERFRREARAAAMLHHPNVVAIYDYGEARDPQSGSSESAPAFIVMELVEGESLRGLLAREGRLRPERAVSLMREVCAGVGAAHRRNVIHRDLKPDNIIVLAAGTSLEYESAKVVDFGIAKLRDMVSADTLTQTGTAMGTPYYMSPEQCRAEHLDARSDVYSLGTVLYEMLAGSPPFTARTATGVVAKHLTEAPPPLPDHAGASASLEAAIMSSLSKDPNARPMDASAFAREIQAAIDRGATRPVAPTIEARPNVPAPTRPHYAPSLTAHQGPAPRTIGGQAEAVMEAPAPKSRAAIIVTIAGALILALLAGAAYWMFTNRVSVAPNANAARAPQNQNTAQQNASQQNASQQNSAPTSNRADRDADTYAPQGITRVESKILNGDALNASDIAGLIDSDLRLLRNTVYARYGRVFDSPDLQQYFTKRSWYRPRGEYSDSDLSSVDRANVALIRSAEYNGAAIVDASSVRKEIETVLKDWTSAMSARDLDAYMTYYADTLDAYYKRSDISLDEVRADKAKAFNRYQRLDVQLSNISIRPDETGARATASFDKAWDFIDGEKHYSGSARGAIWLAKIGGRWRITAEKDL